jgi:hypothetical protein
MDGFLFCSILKLFKKALAKTPGEATGSGNPKDPLHGSFQKVVNRVL